MIFSFPIFEALDEAISSQYQLAWRFTGTNLILTNFENTDFTESCPDTSTERQSLLLMLACHK